MAYATNELFDNTSSDVNPAKRFIPKSTQAKTFAAVGAAPLYKRLTPVAYDTSVDKWKVWANAGANGVGTIAGFLTEDCQIDAANDVLGVVMMAGVVHYVDIELPSGETAANLKTALRSGPRTLDLSIVGLDQVR